MKTVMKKMFCLMLVAVLLVGALPFQASATGGFTVNLTVTIDGVPYSQTWDNEQVGPTINDILYHRVSNGWSAQYDATSIAVNGYGVGLDHALATIDIKSDNTVAIAVTLTSKARCNDCGELEHTGSPCCSTCNGTGHTPAAAHCEVCKYLSTVGHSDTCTARPCPNGCGQTVHTGKCCNICNSDGHAPVAANHCGTCHYLLTVGHASDCATLLCPNGCGAAKHSGACCTKCGNNGHQEKNCNVNSAVVVKFFVNGQLAETQSSPNAATVKSLIDLCTVDDTMRLHYSHATVDGATIGQNDTVALYKTVYIYLVEKAQYALSYNINVGTSGSTAIGVFDAGTTMGTVLSSFTWPARSEFNITGWYWDAGYTQPVYDNQTLPSNHGTTIYPKWTQKVTHAVTLKVYTNGNTSNVVKVLDMYYAAQDGKITEEEVRSAVNGQIKANNNAGLSVYGPFDGNGWSAYCANNNAKNANGYVSVNKNADTYIYVMAHNAELPKTNNKGSKADNSNPKTGDMILMPAAVLGLSASSLAVLYYLDKKKRVM